MEFAIEKRILIDSLHAHLLSFIIKPPKMLTTRAQDTLESLVMTSRDSAEALLFITYYTNKLKVAGSDKSLASNVREFTSITNNIIREAEKVLRTDSHLAANVQNIYSSSLPMYRPISVPQHPVESIAALVIGTASTSGLIYTSNPQLFEKHLILSALLTVLNFAANLAAVNYVNFKTNSAEQRSETGTNFSEHMQIKAKKLWKQHEEYNRNEELFKQVRANLGC
jgi:hypothetical protein